MRSILLGGYMHSDQSLFRSVSAPLQLRSGTVDMLTLITRRTYVQARHQGTPRLFGVRCCELSSPSVTIRVMPSATAKQAWPAGNARIILGSSSYSRQAIMQELAQEYGFNYETATADIDEQALGDRQQNPADLVALLAQAKADAIIGKLRQSEAKPLHGFLLTCDQVVVHQDVIREKPVSQEQAKEFMASYLASPAGTVGAVQCTDLQSGQAFKAVDSTWTHFREIPPEVVDQVVAEGTVMKCAGALMIENPALVPYITQIEGTQDAVMGLPKALVLQVISQAVQASKGQQTVHLRR